MKEYPILFSAPMVRAILDGTKTQTRRVIKPQPIESVYKHDGVTPTFQWKDQISTCRPIWPDVMNKYCPYGQIGDRLWVRETWNCIDTGIKTQRQDWVRYRATDGEEMYWRPSIFMPRWASRITLELTCVRVERLGSITNLDAYNEGFSADECDTCGGSGYWIGGEYCEDCAGKGRIRARDNFRILWNDINEKRGYGWASNPWVWVLTFRQI